MSTQDPVADMLTCIRNAQATGIQAIRVPYSNLKREILKVLVQEGFIHNFDEVSTGPKRDLDVVLKYYQGRPVIEKIKRISRPALRIYKGYDQIPLVHGGFGISVISTPQGVMSDKTARAKKIGGEVLCTVE
jgi:small subunit ribosomal protein S8